MTTPDYGRISRHRAPDPHAPAPGRIATFALALSVLIAACSWNSTELDQLSFPGTAFVGQQRQYPDVRLEQVRHAAEKVLALRGLSVFPTPDGMIAAAAQNTTPDFTPPPDAFWRIELSERGGEVMVSAVLREHYGAPPLAPDNAAYQIFFERLDYLLGLRPDWLSCAGIRERWTGESNSRSISALCAAKTSPEPDPDDPLPGTGPNRAAWLALTTRVFEGITPQQLLEAARQTLKRSQSKFEYRDIPSGFVARITNRRIFFVAVIGGDVYETHFWEVRARPHPSGALASLYVTTEISSTGGAAIPLPIGFSTHSTPGVPSFSEMGSGIYALFWARLDQVLGRTEHWPTCSEAQDRHWSADPDPLCFPPAR